MGRWKFQAKYWKETKGMMYGSFEKGKGGRGDMCCIVQGEDK